jgi:hypothetical protein
MGWCYVTSSHQKYTNTQPQNSCHETFLKIEVWDVLRIGSRHQNPLSKFAVGFKMEMYIASIIFLIIEKPSLARIQTLMFKWPQFR